MNINNYIKIIKNWLYKGTKNGLTNTRLGYIEGWFTKTDKEAFEAAITIMRKYQKIEQIYQKWNEVNDFSYNQAMQDIGKVLENKNLN